uniref:Uncharacterized protein n=1 Tax=Glossina austeni TaxID=7395 RepID=A0A1A9V6A2_GLOAU
MKFLTIAVAVVLMTVAVIAEEQYTTKFDNIDVDEILASDRLFDNYFKCLVDEGKCTPEGRELKKTLPDALETACAKCNDKQKATVDKVIRFLTEKKPAQWKALQAKYDPSGEYLKKYRSEAEKRGIKEFI